jgi:hypothetical protein
MLMKTVIEMMVMLLMMVPNAQGTAAFSPSPPPHPTTTPKRTQHTRTLAYKMSVWRQYGDGNVRKVIAKLLSNLSNAQDTLASSP